MRKLKSFFKKEDGATAIEYGMIAALMVVVILGAMSATGSEVATTYDTIGEEVRKAMTK